MTLLADLMGFVVSIYVAIQAAVAVWVALRVGVDEARLNFAKRTISAMSVLLAASLIKSLTLADWTPLGMFTAVFAIRLLLKATLKSDAKPALAG